ncbi:MAG: HAMP domain-containing histidine kinase [Clostridia bacterium]|nr:HAMP domain-containing histidine kinase [Clostridia bacterium]
MKNSRFALKIIAAVLVVITGAGCLLSAAGVLFMLDNDLFDKEYDRSADAIERILDSNVEKNLAAALVGAYITDLGGSVQNWAGSMTEYGDMEIRLTRLPFDYDNADTGEVVYVSSESFDESRAEGSFEAHINEEIEYSIGFSAFTYHPYSYLSYYYGEESEYDGEEAPTEGTAAEYAAETTTALPEDVSVSGPASAAAAETVTNAPEKASAALMEKMPSYPVEEISAVIGDDATHADDVPTAAEFTTRLAARPDGSDDINKTDVIRADYYLSDTRSGLFSQADTMARIIYNVRRFAIPAFAVSAVCLIISLVLLAFALPAVSMKINKLPFIINVGATGGAAFGCGAAIMFVVLDGILNRVDRRTLPLLLAGLAVIALAAGVMLCLAFCDVVRKIKTRTFIKTTVSYRILKLIKRFYDRLDGNTPLLIVVAVAEAALTLAEIIVLWLSEPRRGEFVALCFIVYKLLEITFIFWLAIQATGIRSGAKRVAAGDYSKPIDTSKMLPAMRAHARDINRIRDGLSTAVAQSVKAERMRAELITNVSHDLKTPLTSIINYSDLLSKKELGDPEAEEYVDAISRQSDKLKKLVTDLVDASKASSGNVDIKPERVSATVLVSQAAGEYDEKFRSRNLTLIINKPEEEVYMLADSRYIWRVTDNLMSNIAKYAMPCTRVYLDVGQKGDRVNITFKNVSEQQLNIPVDELTERFTRGDSSRSMEGSGLGLSIADNLTRLMGGKLTLTINGDLFTADVELPGAAEQPQ